MTEFVRFPSLTRFSHDWVITEKIDGSNAQVFIQPAWMVDEGQNFGPDDCVCYVGDKVVFAGSRNKWLQPGKGTDNMGFAQWVKANAAFLVETLGEGRHFGEWCGAGIQRTYGLKEKKFALFNTHRWGALRGCADGGLLGGQLTAVPVLASGYMADPGGAALHAMGVLKANGSEFAPGFMNPEGVVMLHRPSGTTFKKTFDYDEQGKWAENQSRKETASG